MKRFIFFVRDFCCLMALHKLWDHYARVSFVLILPSRVPCTDDIDVLDNYCRAVNCQNRRNN